MAEFLRSQALYVGLAAGMAIGYLAGVFMFWRGEQRATRVRIRALALEMALAEAERWYPEDVFPPLGVSLDCRSAQFARQLIGNIREHADNWEVAERDGIRGQRH